jgi:hypothetical protein
MFCLSIALDYKLVTAIHLTTLFSMLLFNIFFGLYMHMRLRKHDQPFRYWVDQNPIWYNRLKWSILLYSFKNARIFYSRLFDSKPFCNVPFENKYMTLIRPIFFASITNFLLQAGPIFLMDCYNLMFIPWGYQIMVMSIDNMVLAFVIFVLEIVEFTHFKRLAIEDGDIIYGDGTNGKKFLKINRDVAVYNANMGDDSYLNDFRGQGALSLDDKQAIESMYMTK